MLSSQMFNMWSHRRKRHLKTHKKECKCKKRSDYCNCEFYSDSFIESEILAHSTKFGIRYNKNASITITDDKSKVDLHRSGLWKKLGYKNKNKKYYPVKCMIFDYIDENGHIRRHLKIHKIECKCKLRSDCCSCNIVPSYNSCEDEKENKTMHLLPWGGDQTNLSVEIIDIITTDLQNKENKIS